jgi:hypothetical protein
MAEPDPTISCKPRVPTSQANLSLKGTLDWIEAQPDALARFLQSRAAGTWNETYIEKRLPPNRGPDTCQHRRMRGRRCALARSHPRQAARPELMDEWPYLEQGMLLTTRSRKVCMTCHWFRHHAGPSCIPLTCQLHQGLIAQGEHLTHRCQGGRTTWFGSGDGR